MAVLVLATVIASAILVMQRALSELDAARNLDVAGRILETEIEKERLLDWTQVSNAAYQPVIDAAFLGNPAIAGRFTLSRALAGVPDSAGQLVQATLTVTWRGLDGRSRSRSYTTWFAEGGLNDYLNGTSAVSGTSQPSPGNSNSGGEGGSGEGHRGGFGHQGRFDHRGGSGEANRGNSDHRGGSQPRRGQSDAGSHRSDRPDRRGGPGRSR